MLINRYEDCKDFRDGYREACFDFVAGNLDKEKAFEIQKDTSDVDFSKLFSDNDEDCCLDCDMWNIGYKKGYQEGLEDSYRIEEELYRPEELVIDAIPFNTIEELKDDVRNIIHKLHQANASNDIVNDCWELIRNLTMHEKMLAGDMVLEQYLRD